MAAVEGKNVFPSADRNKGPIWDVLGKSLPSEGGVVTVAEGTGQHASFFASQASPGLTWHPTEMDVSQHASIAAWTKGMSNVRAPVALDVCAKPWPFPDGSVAAIVNINMIHISPWECTEALLGEAGRTLRAEGLLFMYGPYKVGGRFTTPSNEEFDQSLKSRNTLWGIRDLEEVIRIAAAHGLNHVETLDMPANNFAVLYRKKE